VPDGGNLMLSSSKLWSNKKKIGLIVCWWLSVLVITYFLLVSSIQQQLMTTENDQKQLTAKSKQEEKQIPKLLKEQENFLQLQAQYVEYAKLLHREIKNSSLLRYLALSAKQQHVVLQDIQPQSKVENDWLLEYPIQLTVGGSYQQIIGFMQTILTGEYFVVLKDFKLTADKSFKKLTLAATIVFSQNKDADV
jgi:type IV pilus assembly protein PilO